MSRIETGIYIPSLQTFLRIAQELNLTLNSFGVKTREKENKTKEELIKLMHTLNDTELECCYNNIQALMKNFKLLEKRRIKK